MPTLVTITIVSTPKLDVNIDGSNGNNSLFVTDDNVAVVGDANKFLLNNDSFFENICDIFELFCIFAVFLLLLLFLKLNEI